MLFLAIFPDLEMLKFWSVNYTFILGMSEILDNIYIWVFLVNIESVLLLALVKCMLCSHFTQNCIFLYFLEAKNPCFVTKNCSKSSYICIFILLKKQHNWFHKNWLVYNMPSHFNELILVCSAYNNFFSYGNPCTFSIFREWRGCVLVY